MAATTRERLIKTANQRFYRDGFHTVGLDAILDEVGVTKTTFYNHFQSKDDLVLEVLKSHDRWWRDTFRDLLRKHGGPTARGQLEAVFDVLDFVIGSDGFNGCFFVNVAVQFPQAHDPAHEAAAAHKQAMEEIIAEIASYAGSHDPAALAQELALLLEGAYVTAQVNRQINASQVARRIGKVLLAQHLPG